MRTVILSDFQLPVQMENIERRCTTPLLSRRHTSFKLSTKQIKWSLNSAMQCMGAAHKLTRVDSCKGPQHDSIWTTFYYINGVEYGSGEGRKKDEAAENAAKAVLAVLYPNNNRYTR
ncbi:hypothetical protein BDQ17DRAFT_1435259 [Cyathus striatus]|nr:hypothetical protein BDQ17DRAFT_1435259 [Cyathus striatus]